MSLNYSNLMENKSDKEDSVEFSIQDPEIFNPDIKEVTVFYNIVGDARFKLFKNNKSELILVHVTDNWMRQAKIDISKCSRKLDIKITWNKECDVLSVKCDEEQNYNDVKAIQIDN